MLTFVVVTSRTGRPLDPFALEVFETRSGAELSFPPDRHVTWTGLG